MPHPRASSSSPAADARSTTKRQDRSILIQIFAFALVLRWVYAIAMFALMGDDGLKGVDSYTYAADASRFADALRAGAVHGSQWFGHAPYTMPLYFWLASLPFLVFGDVHGTLAYVLLQGALDAGTCIAVYGLTCRIYPKAATVAAILAALNPTQIVLSGLFYTDTPFVFFVALSLLAAARWAAAPTWREAALLGLALGCAALIRVVIVPWAFFALILLVSGVLLRLRAPRKAATILGALLTLSACTGVVVGKNVAVFDTPGLTPQGGVYFALWIVPLAKEMQDRTPYQTTLDELERRTIERFGPRSANPFEQSRRYNIVAKEALESISFVSIAKSWLSGMTINLAAPAVLLSPPVSHLPRPGFYNTPGHSFFDKAFNYVFRSGQPVYTWLLLIGSAGLAAMRLLQLIGCARLLRQTANWPASFFAATWFGYILLVNGPIASPKYRLPLEPLFDVLGGVGVSALRERRPERSVEERAQAT